MKPAHQAEVETYLIDEIFKALGMRADSRWRTLFGPLFTPIVRGLARQAATFDACVGQQGLQQTAQEWLKKWFPGFQIIGNEQLPSQGPLVIAANHPGTADGLVIASIISRQDLRMVTAANPFFRALPETRRYFIYSTRDTHVRMVTFRNAVRHLQKGGALLIFPSGRLDPDPLYFKQAARQSLKHWSNSLILILSKVPQANLVLAINAGFVAPEFLANPISRLQMYDDRRQKLAEFFQVIQWLLLSRQVSNQPSVVFSAPISPSQLLSRKVDIQTQLTEIASHLIDIIPSA